MSSTSISIIGLGNMARSIGARAVEGGNAVDVIGRDPGKAVGLADAPGHGAVTGKSGYLEAGRAR